MMNKIILSSAILAVTSGVALANPAPYVGAGLGITNNTINVTNNSNVTVTNGAYRGVPFSLFVGYGGVMSPNFYLAGELGLTVGTLNLSDNTALKTSYGYGVSILPGVLLSDHTVGYLRAGAVWSKFSSPNTTRVGGQVGVGIQTNVTQNVDLRGEYDYVAYKSIPAGAPNSDQFSLALLYKFD